MGVGVLAAQAGHEAPAAELRGGDGIRRSDVLGVVDRVALVVVSEPVAALPIFVEGVVVHVVEGVLGPGLERPAGREVLFEGEGCRGDVVDARGGIAVDGVDVGAPGRGDAASVVVSGVGIAAGVVGQDLEGRPEGV